MSLTLRSWPLRRKLLVGIVAVVLSALLIGSIATLLSLRASLYQRLDRDVLIGLELAAGPPGSSPGGRDPGPTDSTGPRQRIDTLEVTFAADGTPLRSAYVTPAGETISLTEPQSDLIWSAIQVGSGPWTVEVGEPLGSFRLAAQPTQAGVVVSGLSTRDVSATIASLERILLGVMGATLLVVIVGTAWLVTRTLRPLHRVADTAERVSQRPLAAGAVTLPERAALSADPRTEVGRVGAALDTLLGHVEQALGARQESEDRLRAFIADASHELRTPLASIRGYAQLAQSEDTEKTPTQERSLSRIESEAGRMAALVEDLLLLARLDSGQTQPHGPVDLALLAIEATSDAHAAHPDHHWSVEVNESVVVPGVDHQLRQVFVNLLGNAGAHTPPGTRVTVTVATKPDRALITVSDNGPGIEPDLLPKVFDRFTRADLARNRAAGSTGLGLSIAAAIVQAHGGTIEVTSSDAGTTFQVGLPLHPAD